MLRRIAIAAGFLLAAVAVADAMTLTWRDHLTVHASGPIEKGDAAQFAALPKFDTLELDSPGGSVGEALRIAANMDARGGIRTVVKPGSSCASACAMALFVSGETRIEQISGCIARTVDFRRGVQGGHRAAVGKDDYRQSSNRSIGSHPQE